jgi:hypothetical protein
MDSYGIPDTLQPGLERYLKHRIRPGGFLSAILENDLAMAVLRADSPRNERAIADIVRFLNHEASASAWGSREAVDAWVV